MTDTTTARRDNVATDVALIAVLAGFVAVCAQFSLPFSVNGVAFSLQPFAILLTGAVLGARRGFLAIVLYLVVGAAGLPVFQHGGSGVAQFVGATGGYLLTFPLMALFVGLAVSSTRGRVRPIALLLAGTVGIVVNWFAGAVGVSAFYNLPYWGTVSSLGAFVPADLIKLVIATAVALAVHRAFPQLLGRR